MEDSEKSMQERSLPPVELLVESILKYKVLLLEESGDYNGALVEIDKIVNRVSDIVLLRERKGL